MPQSVIFELLECTESTNNYAMGLINAQMATHLAGYATLQQTAGRGQRGKIWLSPKNSAIALSVIFDMQKLPYCTPFVFSAAVALAAAGYVRQTVSSTIKIKWPNDIYWNDRKAAGILIENKYLNGQWVWAVVGIGINANQLSFDSSLPNPVSLTQITGKQYNIPEESRKLHSYLTAALTSPDALLAEKVLENYNHFLYKKDEEVRLKKESAVFTTTIKHVSIDGALHTADSIERSFAFGEVNWLL